jgi:hypothetical protein
MEIAVVRERAESELLALVERLVDEVLARRRHRPPPQIRALSKRQCATSANLGISSIEAAIRDGDLPASKVGTRTIVLTDDFEHWLASRPRIKPQSLDEDVLDDVSAPKVVERRPMHANPGAA